MVIDDVNEALQVSCGEERENFEKVYGSSNENLKELFQFFSVREKDVLTVLASSDHFFYALSLGARTIDTFDQNPLTKYYYYLRRWLLLYRKEFYLPKKAFRNENYLEDLLDDVHPEDEEEKMSLQFWKTYLKKATPKIHEGLYCSSPIGSKNKLSHIDFLRERLCAVHPTFYPFDLFGEVVSFKQYDIIISNILEYGINSMRLCRCEENLKSLLRPGGEIISSRFASSWKSDLFRLEQGIFMEDFDFLEFIPERKSPFSKEESLGYSYQKR